jgi:hypothetical protein
MRFIAKREKVFIFELKENRQVTDNEREKNQGELGKLDQLGLLEDKPVKVWIKDLEFLVLVFKQLFRNKDGMSRQHFLVSNGLALTDEQFKTLYKKRC